MALNYGKATLFSILSTMSVSQPLSPAVWTNLVRAGITRVKPTRRGSPAGRLKRRAIATLVSNSRQPSVQMGYSGFLEQNVNKVTGNLHSEVSELNVHSDTSRRTTNFIVVERSPLLPTQKDRSPMLTLCHANVRAVKSKTACLREYINSNDMDIFALTETWLTEKDTAATLEIYSPESQSFIQQDRNWRRGGGTGLLFKKAIDVKKIAAGEKSSFEFSEWRVSFNLLRVKLVVVYRPPYSEAHPITPRVFFEEFGSYLETIILSPESFILTGDYNFHVDVEDNPDARTFLDLLASMGLKQHVNVLTHVSGHTLDLLMTREHDPVTSSVPVADRYLSDHASVLCSLNSAKPDCVAKIIRYRQLRAIDFDALRQDVEKSELCTREYSDLNELTSSYNSTLTSLLDKHAPMKEKVVVCRQRLPCFNSEIKCAIRTRRKAERKWRRTKSQQNFRAFKGARNRATFVMNGARCEYYTNIIAENGSNQRNLFGTTKSLLCEPSEVSFPKDIAPDDLANGCGNFFMQKIDKINQLIDMQSSFEMSKAGEKGCADPDTCAGVTFANFKTVSQEQVSELIKKAAKKSCPLDPMPTSVVLEVLDVLLPVITNMINLSFESGEFASDWKEALLKPLLKKCGLDIAFHNFRPVSNLPYVSKLSEKAAANQLINHMTTNNLHMPLQSAYKQDHSTESALLKVKNDILLNIEAQRSLC